MSKYKILLLVANHTSNNIKYNICLNNISILKPYVEDIVIINSTDEIYAKILHNDLLNDSKIKNFLYIHNDHYFDFGKWIFGLTQIDVNQYDYICFTNDSIIITEDIKNYFHYIDNVMDINTELYAYNDSTQIKYHYQSYLFLVKSSNISQFINYFENNRSKIYNLESLIHNVELNMCEIYEKHDVFLKIGQEYNNSKNLFWENEDLYQYLLSKNILCILKVKKIFDIQKDYKVDIYGLNITNFDYEFYKSYYEIYDMNNEELLKHFVEVGQYEGRKFTKNFNCILPSYYREKLEKLNILYFFDVPIDFDIYYYKKHNIDLENFSNIDCIYHYINHGFYEGRIYNKQHDKNNYLNDIYLNFLLKFNKSVPSKNIIDNKLKSFNLFTYMLLNNYLQKNGYMGILHDYLLRQNKNISFTRSYLEKKLINFDLSTYLLFHEELKQKDFIYVLQHYISNNLDNNKLYKIPNDFNPHFYKKIYKDLIKLSDHEATIHYLMHGFLEKRIYKLPDDFDPEIYKSFYKELEKFNHDQLIHHYLTHGIHEKKIYKIPNDFNPKKYKKIYQELVSFTDIQLMEHYMFYGIYENRIYKIPENFDHKLYKKIYNDLKELSNHELENHYLFNGIQEGRIYKIPDDFDPAIYLKINNDLSDLNHEELIHHYLFHGIHEKRIYKLPNDFDPIIYKKIYNDLNDLDNIQLIEHYLTKGIKENRIYKINDDFDIKLYKELYSEMNEEDIKINYTKNKLYKIPSDFNPKTYKNMYEDLKNMNDDDLKKHYLLFGIKEKRLYKIPEDFNPIIYKKIYNDLSNLSNNELLKHYLKHGIYENRIYKLPDDFNVKKYKKKNKDLKNMDDNELRDHYLYKGIHQNRKYK